MTSELGEKQISLLWGIWKKRTYRGVLFFIAFSCMVFLMWWNGSLFNFNKGALGFFIVIASPISVPIILYFDWQYLKRNHRSYLSGEDYENA